MNVTSEHPPTTTATYTVVPTMTTAGTACYRVHNIRTNSMAASMPTEAKAQSWADFMNQQESDPEVDADWVPGSNSNWWARNRGEGV